MKSIRNFFSDEAGQTATEYMLLISVIVVAVVAGAYTFVPAFQGGVIELAKDLVKILHTGMIGNTGTEHS